MEDTTGGLSRREFLKLSGLGLLGLIVPGYPPLSVSDLLAGLPDRPPLQGRIASDSLWSYEIPSSKGRRVKMYWRDLIVDIDNTAIDEDASAYNRIWYKLGDGSYLYSGWVQPVRTVLSEPASKFPRDGLLGEVSVPYTDAHESPNSESKVVYRLYYETTHWVMETVAGPDGNAWVRLLDDKYKKFYFAPARHVRIIPASEFEPISPDVPRGDKRIEISLSRQLVLAYEAGRPVYAARASTGAVYRLGTYTTPTGRFNTFHKRPSRHMANGDITASGFDLPGVPWVLYIKDNGISIHGTYWHNDFGKPHSHGCINLSPSAARWLYRWSLPRVAPEKQFVFERASATRVDVVS